MSNGIVEEVEALLRRASRAADDLEADVRAFTGARGGSGGARGKETWTISENNGERSSVERQRRKKRRNNERTRERAWVSSTKPPPKNGKEANSAKDAKGVPGVGAYDPDYFVGRKTSSAGGRFHPLPRRKRASMTRRRARRRQQPAKCAADPADDQAAFDATSRAKRVVGGVIHPPRSTAKKPKQDLAGEYIYQPDMYAVLPRAPAFAFAPERQRCAQDHPEDAGALTYDVEGARKAVERRPAGGKMNPPRTNRGNKTGKEEEGGVRKPLRDNLNISRAEKMTRPRVKGPTWRMPSKRRSDDARASVDGKKKHISNSSKPASKAAAPPGTFSYAKPVEKTEVYAAHVSAKEKNRRRLGPGAYGAPSENATSKYSGGRCASFGRAPAAKKRKRRRAAGYKRRLGPGAYNILPPRAVKGGEFMPKHDMEERAKAKRQARIALERELASIKVKEKKCTRKAVESEGEEVSRYDDESGYGSDSSSSGGEGKRAHGEGKWSDDSSYEWDEEHMDEAAEDVAIFLAARRAKAFQSRGGNSQQRSKKAKQYVALRDHRQRARASQRPIAYDVKHGAVESRVTSVLSMGAAVEAKKKQDEANKKIASRVKAAEMNKYDRILQSIGVDAIVAGGRTAPDGFIGSQLQDDWGNDASDPTKRQKPTFRYREDAELPEAAARKRREKEIENRARGPGAYAPQTHVQWNDTGDIVHDRQEMTRALGRERVKVTRKDRKKLKIPFYDVYKLDEGKGPGAYDVHDEFGAFAEAAGAIAFDKMGAGHGVGSDDDADGDKDGDVLILSPGADPGKMRAAGAGGYTFSTLPRGNLADDVDDDDDAPKLELNPNVEYAKYSSVGGLVPFDKLGGRSPSGEAAFEDERILDLSTEKARKFLDPRVKTGVSMAKARGRADAAKSREPYPDVVYDPEKADKHVRRKTVFTAIMDRYADERFEEDDPERSHDYNDAEYDAAGARDAMHAYGKLHGEWSKQAEDRFPSETLEAWQEAVYEPNEDALTQRKRTVNAVDMSKMLDRNDDADDGVQDDRVLDLDPLAGEELMSRFKRLQMGVDMSSQRGRAEEDAKQAKKLAERPSTPSPRAIARGEAKLHHRGKHRKRNPEGALSMAQQLGRDDDPDYTLQEGGDTLMLSPKTPPAKQKRPLGGAFSKAPRATSPSAAAASSKGANAGNVVIISPKDNLIRERTRGGSMARATSRRDEKPAAPYDFLNLPKEAFTSPARVDVEAKKDAMLRPRVKGGAAMKPSTAARKSSRRRKSRKQSKKK